MTEHIADHPTFKAVHRAVTSGRLTLDIVHDLERQGYDILGALVTMHRGHGRQALTDAAAKGRLTQHDLMSALVLDRNGRQP